MYVVELVDFVIQLRVELLNQLSSTTKKKVKYLRLQGTYLPKGQKISKAFFLETPLLHRAKFSLIFRTFFVEWSLKKKCF